MKHLGRKEVPVVIVSHLEDALQLLQAERDENFCRKDFAPSEAVAIGRKIEALERPQAKQRQRDHGSTAPGRKKITGDKLAPVSAPGKTRDKVAPFVGMSGSTYAKTKAVVQAAEADPEQFGHLVEQMDKTGKVDAAYREVKGHSTPKSKKKAAASKASESAAGNGKVETLTIAKSITTAENKALAAKLLDFLGHDLCQELARIWTKKNTGTKRPGLPAKGPKNKRPKRPGLPAKGPKNKRPKRPGPPAKGPKNKRPKRPGLPAKGPKNKRPKRPGPPAKGPEKLQLSTNHRRLNFDAMMI